MSSNETLSKVSKEIKDLVGRGVYSLFRLEDAQDIGASFILVTDKIQEGKPLVFWLDQSGLPVEQDIKKPTSQPKLGEKMSFESTFSKSLNYSR